MAVPAEGDNTVLLNAANGTKANPQHKQNYWYFDEYRYI